ncbi:hypothetical protein AWJ20_3803 [Sugiyamaella lignohabitans]|uniref:DUF3020 domain-containing protein n=1 Tax=Sugiyamaella lignohabitans TaxID=796027 RepID=A0A167BZ89_9ASCO|nr:uncharacterized protein AWJ20_3803 [Sugiyamaella lignohabitans]ANB11009.1 hypothetical protein AWJ20_3803 [Sugiyamaella lignohabitans]
MSDSNPPPLPAGAGDTSSAPVDIEAQLKALLAGLGQDADGDKNADNNTNFSTGEHESEEQSEDAATEAARKLIENALYSESSNLEAGVHPTADEQRETEPVEEPQQVDPVSDSTRPSASADMESLLLEQTLAEVQKALADDQGLSGQDSESQPETNVRSTQDIESSKTVQDSHIAIADQEPDTKENDEQNTDVDQGSLNALIQNALTALDDQPERERQDNQDDVPQAPKPLHEEPTVLEHPSSKEQTQHDTFSSDSGASRPSGEPDQAALASAIANALAGVGTRADDTDGSVTETSLQDQIAAAVASVSQEILPVHEDTNQHDTAAITEALVSSLSGEGANHNQEPDVLHIQQELQRILANDVSQQVSADTESHPQQASQTEANEDGEPEFDADAAAASVAEALAKALQQGAGDIDGESGNASAEETELAAQKALMEQLSSALREESAGHIQGQTGDEQHSVEGVDVQAMAELLSGSDLESTLSSILSGMNDPPQQEEPPRSNLSIAETLAISRSNIEKSREKLAKRIDPMLNRRGYLQSWSVRRQQHQQQQQRQHQEQPRQTIQPQQDADIDPLLQFSSETLPSQEEQSSDQIESGDGAEVPADSMLAALLLAKQMIGDEEATSEGQDLSLNEDAMEAVQQALQALSKSIQEEGASGTTTENNLTSDSTTAGNTPIFSSLDQFRTTRKYKPRRYRANAVLTPEDKERIRMDNRERKKRWRSNNNIRNKDNDLRARLHRRATNMFGPEDSPEKKSWFDKEFQKRREKRMLREMQLDPDFQRDDENSNGFVNINSNNNANGNSSSAESLRAALEILGKTEGLNEGLAQTVDSLVKDPQLLKTLMGDLFGNEESNNVSNNTSTATNYTFQPHANVNKPIAGGGIMSTFKIRKTESQPRAVQSRPPTAQPQFPSKYPDRGLTTLVRRAMKSRGRNTGGFQQPSQSTQPSVPRVLTNVPPLPNMSAPDPVAAIAGALSMRADNFSDVQQLSQPPQSLKRKPSLETISVTVSPKPPTYFGKPASRPSSVLQPAKKFKTMDNRAKAFGFPPLLSAMSTKR